MVELWSMIYNIKGLHSFPPKIVQSFKYSLSNICPTSCQKYQAVPVVRHILLFFLMKNCKICVPSSPFSCMINLKWKVFCHMSIVMLSKLNSYKKKHWLQRIDHNSAARTSKLIFSQLTQINTAPSWRITEMNFSFKLYKARIVYLASIQVPPIVGNWKVMKI
jgi:hypothetical protein